MKRLIAFALFLQFFQLHADEELWLPLDLSDSLLQARGITLPSGYERWYVDSGRSLTQGVLHFGSGCTAVVVSDSGLMFTNHHCARHFITSLSTVERNLLKDGFCAKDKSEELACDGLKVTQILAMTDVTETVKGELDLSKPLHEQYAVVKTNLQALEKELSNDSQHVFIKSFDHRQRYIAFRSKELTDVRLVACPPEGLGNFGGDFDNWMWPRHTADFSVFRVYEDGEPWQPSVVISVADSSIGERDTTVIVGFPWNTHNFLPHQGIAQMARQTLPWSIYVRETSMLPVQEKLNESDSSYLRFSPRYARLSNSYKKWKGQQSGLLAFDAIDKRKAQLASLKIEDADQLNELLVKYDTLYANFWPFARDQILISEFHGGGSEWMDFLDRCYRLFGQHATNPAVGDMIQSYQWRSDKAMDRLIFQRQYELLLDTLTQHWVSEYSHVFIPQRKMNRWLGRTIIGNTDRLKQKWESGGFDSFQKAVSRDPLYRWYLQWRQGFYGAFRRAYSGAAHELVETHVLLDEFWSEGLGVDRYHDANGTLRVNFGVSSSFHSFDGTVYPRQTYLSGLHEKMASGHLAYELNASDSLLLHGLGEYTGAVCFVASHHTSGGNSGSPVFNVNGELVGLNFDRAWESTMSDYWYDTEICRNISVDSQYILAVLEAIGGKWLIEEIKP